MGLLVATGQFFDHPVVHGSLGLHEPDGAPSGAPHAIVA
jgi:hypothetical protein